MKRLPLPVPTGQSLSQSVRRLVQAAIDEKTEVAMTFTNIELVANPDSCEADILAHFWQASTGRALAYETACRSEYDQLVDTVRGGVPLDSDQRMWIKQVEAVLGIPPEMSILLHTAT